MPYVLHEPGRKFWSAFDGMLASVRAYSPPHQDKQCREPDRTSAKGIAAEMSIHRHLRSTSDAPTAPRNPGADRVNSSKHGTPQRFSTEQETRRKMCT